MRIFVRLLVIALGLLLALIFLGPMAPEGTFIAELAGTIRQALNAWWGFPLGLPTN